jgi:hypothetical protein
MKIQLIIGIATLFSGSAALAETLSPAKAAELTCHRIERLVTLRKIPDTFLNRLYSVELQALPNAKPGSPYFRSLSSQVPDSTGHAQQLELLLDAAGKAMMIPGKTVDFNLIAGPESVDAPVWPDKDPVTLTENALHYVLDNAVKEPTLLPFYNGFAAILLTQVKNEAGQPLARAEIHAAGTRSVLEVIVKADGTFGSARILNP